ncbi:MAG: cytochrome b/b6 domain-containing protein [Rhodospirillales bacterium]
MSDDLRTETVKTAEMVYVWDMPTRLFHWLLLVAVTTSLISAETGYMSIHVISGHVVLALVLFRLVWGIVGGRYARFANFVKGPARVFAYAKKLIGGSPAQQPGHNPMGGWSVLAMIGLLALQVGTGLFSNDDILTEGPLAPLVSNATSNFLTKIHALGSTGLYVLIGLHLAAVAFYTVKGHPIIGAMITGKTPSEDLKEQDAPTVVNVRGSGIVAVCIIIIAAAVAYAIKTY